MTATALSPSVAQPSANDVIAHRAYLVRFARRRLRDPMLAEDAVHDVFEAVLSGRASFGGRAALRSWLTAVLKHKIVDAVRRSPRHLSLDDDETSADPTHGSARSVPCDRPQPDEIAEQRERLARTLEDIERLPPTLREAMRMRVIDDRDTADICAELGISESNLFVRVHRARRLLLS